jgi:glycosyltransferase involved in cell wall biosynthesis
MKPLTTILTATYNKPGFFREAAQSVLGQTSGDWRWWVVFDGANEETTAIAQDLARRDARIVLFTEKVEDRYDRYRPAALANKYIPLVSTPYFCFHSDDDLKEPCFIEALVGALEANPGHHVAYGVCRTYVHRGEEWVENRVLPEDPLWRFGPDSALSPDRRLNDGQIVQTKASWDQLGWQFPTDFEAATHVDGVYLTKLARRFAFLFVNTDVLRVRHTRQSENWRAPPAEQVWRPAVTLPSGKTAEDGPHVCGHVELALTGGHAFLVLEGWLAGSRPLIKRVWLRDQNGVKAAVPFKWQAIERPDLSAGTKGVLAPGHTTTGYRLFIVTPGLRTPRELEFEQEDGSRWTVDLPERMFTRMTEIQTREMLHRIGSPGDLPAVGSKEGEFLTATAAGDVVPDWRSWSQGSFSGPGFRSRARWAGPFGRGSGNGS